MSAIHDPYLRLPSPTDRVMAPCPCCGAEPELWQYQKTPDGDASKAVMCSTSESIGPQDALMDEGCPLYLPGDSHYKATQREAIAFWNDYAAALQRMQRSNRWKRHSALRKGQSA